jgi:hypothetical protein
MPLCDKRLELMRGHPVGAVDRAGVLRRVASGLAAGAAARPVLELGAKRAEKEEREKHALSSVFPRVCPEPVLAKHRFAEHNGAKGRRLKEKNLSPSVARAGHFRAAAEHAPRRAAAVAPVVPARAG